MKKFILFIGMFLFSAFSFAEELKFVTTLSSAMGTFAALETADPSARTTSPLVNFCNTRASVGAISVAGANAYIENLTLKNATTLGGNAPEFRVAGALTLRQEGTLTGGRLMAADTTVDLSTDPKSKVEETLFVASMKLKGAKTEELRIPNQVQTVAGAEGTLGTNMGWSNEYDCDYETNNTPAPPTQYPWTRMVRYNADTDRFISPEGTNTYDTCDYNPLTKYSGTPEYECIDVWLDGDVNNMAKFVGSKFTISQSDSDCNAWTMNCGDYYKVLPICNQQYANANLGQQYGDGTDIAFALSYRHTALAQNQRWKKYVPTTATSNKFFGKLKTTYQNWLKNMDWELGHPYSFNVCLVSGVARSGGIEYTISYGTTSFKATQHLPKQEPGGSGKAECVSAAGKYGSYLLKG